MIFNMGAPTIRWVGNEDGVAPYPCWNTAESAKVSMFSEASLSWLPDTPAWVPAECDVPIRKDHWFWHPDDEHSLHSLEHLLDIYYRSVGHGCNLLLNLAPDNTGLLPEADVKRVIEFGDEVKRRFSNPIVQTSGATGILELHFDSERSLNHFVIMEDISHGERVREYVLEVWKNGGWVKLLGGSAIGHKKIDRFEAVLTDRVRLRIVESVEQAQIRSFIAYSEEDKAV
jgi:alpha-L-fucosidase